MFKKHFTILEKYKDTYITLKRTANPAKSHSRPGPKAPNLPVKNTYQLLRQLNL